MTRYQADSSGIRGTGAREIAASVEGLITTGQLPEGAILPPIRALAGSLGVSAGTVAAAYRLVRERGLTVPEGRRGTAVRATASGEPDGAFARGSSGRFALDGIVDISTGNPDPSMLPPLGPVLRRLDPDRPLYGCAAALPQLVQLFRDTFEADGVPVISRAGDGSALISVTSGALDAIQRILSHCLRAGDAVAVEDPGWHATAELVRSLGLRPRPVNVDEHGPLPGELWDCLAAGARALVTTSRAQNPTGAAVTADRAGALRAVLSRYPDVVVVEDDHGFALTDVSVNPLVGSTRRYAFVRSVAKALGPDLRLAVVSSDEITARALEASYSTGAGWVSHLLQGIVTELLSDPSVGTQLSDAQKLYDERRRALVRELDAAGLTISAPSGLNVWVPVRDEAAAVSSMLGDGWLVAAGRRFRLVVGPAVRVTTSSLSEADAPLAAASLARAASGNARPPA